jgi:DNA polymerase elongation subunit (family B)
MLGMIELTKLSDQELLAYKKKISNKVSKYKNTQLAKKVILNAAYGVMANEYFRFYDVRLAEAITLSGQLISRWLAKDFNAYLNKLLKSDHDFVIAGDTDSVYLGLEKLVDACITDKDNKTKIVNFLDRFCEEKLSKVISNTCNEVAEYLNVFEQKIEMKREKIADRGIWTAKKHYILNVYDSEGVRYTKPELKYQGIEAIKSSTPEFFRDKMKAAVEIIMTKTEKDMQTFIESIRTKTKEMDPEAISFPRGVNGLDKYCDSATIYRKSTPMHVRGVLLYNHLLKKEKLTRRYPLIREGEKIKYVYLKIPNTIGENVIAFSDKLPDEFDLVKYIDYDMQFEKAFLAPMQDILDVIGWKTEETNTMFDLFG